VNAPAKSCADCAVSLWGTRVRCFVCQRDYEARLRAAAAREAKQHARAIEQQRRRQAKEAEARRIEAALAARAAWRRRHRLTLSEADIWRCTGRGVASCGGAL
jgi:hypothetical protein